MRRSTMLVLGLLATVAALPDPAMARPRGLPGALLGVITRPLGMILGGVPRAGRRAHQPRRATVSRNRPAEPAKAEVQPLNPPASGSVAPAAAAAGVGVAGGIAAANAAAKPSENKPGENKPDEIKPAELKIDGAKPAVEAKAPTTKAPTADVVTTDETKAPPESPSTKAPVTTASAPPAESAPVPQASPVQASPVQAVPVQALPTQRNAALQQPAAEPLQPQPRASEPARPSQPQARSPYRLGIAGPATWPSAFEDVIGFTLWPGEYSDRLRAHGIGDVVGSVFASASSLARIRGGTAFARADAGREAAGSGGRVNPCNADVGSGDWPAGQIERTVELNATQRAALTQLKSAITTATASVRAACRDEASLSPADRLPAMQGTLWAVHDAVMQVRGPLTKFYESLTDEQRSKFGAPQSAQADPRSMNQAAIARMCGAPGMADGPARQLEQTLNPTKAQRASIETFQRKSSEMGQFLMASCLRPVAATPAERLDAAADRLTAVIFAASTVSLALNDFYNQLSDEQKNRFHAAGR